MHFWKTNFWSSNYIIHSANVRILIINYKKCNRFLIKIHNIVALKKINQPIWTTSKISFQNLHPFRLMK